MTHQSHSLSVVLEQAKSSRDHAFVALESSRKFLEDAKYKLQSLQSFRCQYEERWHAQFKQAGGMEIMRCYQDFIARLSSAVAEQAIRVEQLHFECDNRRKDLILFESKLAAVQKLIDRREQEVFQVSVRKEQRDTDEMASRMIGNQKKADAPFWLTEQGNEFIQ